MSYNNLKKFVKQQAILGKNHSELREGLLLNGWDKKDVDRAISEVYGFKKRILRFSLIVLVLLIIIFSISLLLIFGDFYEISDEKKELFEEEQIISNDCASATNISLREECYFAKIKEGFMCEDLIDEELFYCSRALDFYIYESYNNNS